jgi:hypothetical protein
MVLKKDLTKSGYKQNKFLIIFYIFGYTLEKKKKYLVILKEKNFSLLVIENFSKNTSFSFFSFFLFYLAFWRNSASQKT